MINNYPHLIDSLKGLLTKEELNKFGYFSRSIKTGLWDYK